MTSEEAPAKGSEVANDFDAAKIAAMKAAELGIALSSSCFLGHNFLLAL